jgi:vacuolar-type H+-ATPase subunit D/Vma8
MTIYTTGEVDAQALALLLKERDALHAKIINLCAKNKSLREALSAAVEMAYEGKSFNPFTSQYRDALNALED